MSQIEKKLLARMTEASEISQVWDLGLREEAFEDISCRAAYGWMIEYWQNHGMQLAPSWVVMEHEFPTLNLPKPDKEEGLQWVVSTLQRRYMVNQVQQVVMEASATLDIDPEATTSRLWQQVYDISESTVPRTERSDMSNVEDRHARYLARSQMITGGMPTGLDVMDQHTHGFLPGELGMVAAFTKVGKSFLLCKAMTAAHLAGYRPILFSLEMSIKEMEDRIDAFYSGVSYAQLTSGSMMPADERRLIEARETLASMPQKMRIERPPRGERTVKALVNRARQTNSDFLLIDQLSFMDPAPDRRYAGDNSGMRMKHGDITFDLKDEIGRESAGALPCFLAVQQNRDSQKSGDGRGALHNIANSSFIEQTADIVFGLWQNDDMRNSNQMGIDIMGSRRSDKRSWILNWRLNDRTDVSVLREYDE